MQTLPKRTLRNTYSCPNLPNHLHDLIVHTNFPFLMPIQIHTFIHNIKTITCSQVIQLPTLEIPKHNNHTLQYMQSALQWQSETIKPSNCSRNSTDLLQKPSKLPPPQTETSKQMVMIEKQIKDYIKMPFPSASDPLDLYEDQPL